MVNNKNKEAIDNLKSIKKSLEEEKERTIEKIDSDIRSLENTISILEVRENGTLTITTTYSGEPKVMTDTLRETVLKTVTEKIRKFETSTVIANMILDEYYPNKTEEERERFKTQVSSLLSQWKGKRKVASYQYSTSKKDNVWGRKEWLTDGKPKEGYFIHPRLIENTK